MYLRCSLASITAMVVALAACSETDREGGALQSAQAVEYVEPCTPEVCDGLAVPPIGCADGTTTLSCAPGGDGTCSVAVKCEGGGSVVSYTPCDESECGPVPAIGCAEGNELVASCGSENGGECRWTITCEPPPSTTPCPTEDGCGPMPLLAPICDDGTAGTLACMLTGDGCTWQPDCP